MTVQYDALTSTLAFQMIFNVAKNGLGVPPTVSSSTVSKSVTYTLGTTAASTANELVIVREAITASGTATINLSSSPNLTDLCQQGSIVFARIKGFFVWLLATGDTAPDGTAGSAASSIAVGNAVSHPAPLELSSGVTTRTINNGMISGFWSPNGTGFAITSSSNDQLLITNNDGGVTAQVLLMFLGSST